MKDAQAISLQADGEDVVIAVKVVPGSSRDRVVGVLGDQLKIATSAAAEKGKANAAIARTLAKSLGLSTKDVQLESGQTNPQKRFRLREASVEDIRTKLCAM
jgi:uncharacterized protein (TIGR00251 family)